MPPKAKFTKEQIIEAALDIVREDGMEAVTARSLGKRLGSSACPIFTVFENMEEVLQQTQKAAKCLYAKYVERGLTQNPAFKGVGTQYILFSIKEPKIFQMLFMSEQPQELVLNNVLPAIEEHYDAIMSSIQNAYNLSVSNSEKLYRHLWIYTHGIAALCATNTCKFAANEISEMLTEVCMAVLKQIKEKNL